MSGIVGGINLRSSGLVNNSSAADGQLFTGTGAGLPVGFEAAAGGGKVLQCVSVEKTDVFTHNGSSAATWTDITGFTIDITPVATSKILVLVHASIANTAATNSAFIRLLQDSTAISVGTGSTGSRILCGFFHNHPATYNHATSGAIIHLTDVVGSTSTITFKCQGKGAANGDTFVFNRDGDDADNVYRGRTAGSITAIEIGA